MDINERNKAMIKGGHYQLGIGFAYNLALFNEIFSNKSIPWTKRLQVLEYLFEACNYLCNFKIFFRDSKNSKNIIKTAKNLSIKSSKLHKDILSEKFNEVRYRFEQCIKESKALGSLVDKELRTLNR